MAESKRQARHASPVVTDDEAQKRRDRTTLLVILVGMVAVVIGMVFLSRFLSGS